MKSTKNNPNQQNNNEASQKYTSQELNQAYNDTQKYGFKRFPFVESFSNKPTRAQVEAQREEYVKVMFGYKCD